MNTSEQIDRAKELLKTARHASMATVNDDGTPHNSPFFFLHDENMQKVYWGSHPESQHSKNILRTGQLFVVLYDAIERGGLYVKAEDGHITEGKELEVALQTHNEFRKKEGRSTINIGYYTTDSPQRMWSAIVTRLWVNDTRRDEKGNLIEDYRREVSAQDLIT
jgi:hypothetical protein